jgi:hypothetical protein
MQKEMNEIEDATLKQEIEILDRILKV